MRVSAAGLSLVLALTVSGCALPTWPVEAPMTSAFGLRFPGLVPRALAVDEGTPVRAMADAHVRFAGSMSGYGDVVWLDHGGAVLSVYAHLSEIRVTVGMMVRRGSVLGLSGATGDVTGPHLHFEVWRWGRPVDPVPLLGRKPSH